MPAEIFTPGQVLTAAELTLILNMLPYPQVTTVSVNPAAAGTLYRCQPSGGAQIVLTLPPPTAGTTIGAKLDASSGSVLLTQNTSELIYGPETYHGGARGAISVTLAIPDEYIVLIADGSNWHIVTHVPTPRPMARIWANAGPSIPNSAWTVLDLDTVDFDSPGGMATTGSAAHFTAPYAGKYLIDARCTFGASVAAGPVIFDAAKNVTTGYGGGGGTRLGELSVGAGQQWQIGAATVLLLAAGDTVTFWIYQVTGGTVVAIGGNAPFATFASMTFMGQ